MDNHVNDSIGGAHLFNGKNVDFVEDRFGRAKSVTATIKFHQGSILTAILPFRFGLNQ